ncbi:hypothetical protein E2C01_081303 [Portunus trituberculatus]|uniref:Uncharacterized protein n=1 Tax=Portunus trituberculatus TaxID=210409 RepID=A0A5B7IVX8_PORTR|nr:hypothetical protein [Portunus trituberculatus]
MSRSSSPITGTRHADCLVGFYTGLGHPASTYPLVTALLQPTPLHPSHLLRIPRRGGGGGSVPYECYITQSLRVSLFTVRRS